MRSRNPNSARASFAQRSLWAFAQRNRNAPMDVLIMRWHVKGALDVASFERAINDVFGRHVALRCSLRLESGKLVQVVQSDAQATFSYVLAGGVSIDSRYDDAIRITREAGRVAGGQEIGAIGKAVLVRLGDAEHLLSLIVHHAMCDGWSSQVLISEISQCYAARSCGRAVELPEIEESFIDFSEAQYCLYESGGYAEEIEYWLSELDNPPPPVQLPAVRPRNLGRHFECSAPVRVEPADVYLNLRNLARSCGVTVFSALMAILALLLNRRSGSDDMLIGVSTLNRWRPKSMGFVGCATNLLPARLKLGAADTARDLCVRTNATIRRLLTYGRLPLELLLNETRSTMFDTMQLPIWCQFREAAPRVQSETGQGVIAFMPLPIERAMLVPEIEIDLIGADEGLRCEFAYRTALFSEAEVSGLMSDFHSILLAVLLMPGAPVDRVVARLD